MNKEIIICLIVLVIVIVGNILTQNNTKRIVEEMQGKLMALKDEIQSEQVEQEKVANKMKQVEEIWQAKYETMAYYIEHDELEKVETELTRLKADIETEEYAMAVENLDSCAFILEHIKDKTALKIVNLF